MRLIDVDEITDSDIANCLGAEYYSCVPDVRDMLNEQPTAYNPETVIERMKDYAIEFETFGTCSDYVELSHAIGLVKGGRVDEIN